MTREEAIEILCAYGVPQDEKGFREALDMAIEALTQDSRKVTQDSTQDLISRRDALEYFMTNTNWHDEDGYPIEDWDDKRKLLEDYFNGIPSADRSTGEWINREKCQVDEDAYEVATCSKCGAEITIEYPHDSYCSNCGAKMRGEKNDKR